MKKSLRIYFGLWVAAVVLSAMLIVLARMDVFAHHHMLAQDSANIEKITKLDLPEPVSVDSWDNLERSSSRWDCFNHRSHFAEKLSDDCVRQLDNLCQTDSIHWCKDEDAGFYEYRDGAFSDGYCISCRIYEDCSVVEYYIDELEGLDFAIYGLLAILLVVFVLVVWGIVMLVKIIFLQYSKQQNHNGND